MPTRPVAVIIGMMGAGKTRVGKEVAQLMSLPFADADVEIEHEVGMRIPEYFERHGEPAFREVESEVIAGMLHGFGGVFALGGGAPMTPAVQDDLKEYIEDGGKVVYLMADPREAMERAHRGGGRPMLQGDANARWKKLYRQRDPVYYRVANVHVETYGQTPLAAARKMMDMITERTVHVTGATIEDYDVSIGEGAMNHLSEVLGPKPVRIALIHTQPVQRHSDRARTLLRQGGYQVSDIVIPDAEAGKTIEVANGIWQRLGDEGFTRSDAVVGVGSCDEICEVLNRAEAGEKPVVIGDNSAPVSECGRLISTGPAWAYLLIAEGCDNRCSYCAIPIIRGGFQSRSIEDVVEEAKMLAASGVVELNVIAQDTTRFGEDNYHKLMLPQLLDRLCEIDGIRWIRLLYCYPEEITDELIEAIKTEEKVCNYIDMPIQHSENRILQRMGRRTSREDLVAVIKKLRQEIPDITIRTTLITGFPGESEEDHEGLMNFVEECKFDRLGVFTYSPEEDTLAATFEDQIDEEVKEARRDELMSLQQEISYEHTQQLVGKTIKVMVEGYLFEDDIYVGRSYMDAPKVDGCVFINSPEELMTGDFVYVKITQGREYDVIGEVDYEFTK